MESDQNAFEQIGELYFTEFYDKKENTERDIGLAQIGDLDTDQSGFKAI